MNYRSFLCTPIRLYNSKWAYTVVGQVRDPLKKVIVSQSNVNRSQILVYIAVWGYAIYHKSLPVVFYTVIAKNFPNWQKHLIDYILTCLAALFSCVGATETENWKMLSVSFSKGRLGRIIVKISPLIFQQII